MAKAVKKTAAKREELFWADKTAQQIIRLTKEKVPTLKKPAIKTSASASGVFHIGRLSDVVRNEALVIALRDAGVKARFVQTLDDMDPFRKIPAGVPASYEEYIGAPVTDVPDPHGCHESFGEHHISEGTAVLKDFVSIKLETFSMREEYRKGSFKPYIEKLLKSIQQLREIQNKYRKEAVATTWSPWQPVCKHCGKIITARVQNIFEDGKVAYVCQDYKFEETQAKGCGHSGVADSKKDLGKLVYKSEWAAQWAFFKCVAEAAGKEYQVPGSAFWINSEISEKILGWIAPLGVFYEHLFIDNKKMSASLGNVVYPRDWLAAAPSQLLRYFYLKKLMKTRSFSWSYLPELYHEYDETAKVFAGEIKIPNRKEAEHIKRLYLFSQLNTKAPEKPNPLPFNHAAVLAQIVKDESKLIDSIKRTGHFDKARRKDILARVERARNWIEKYAPAEYKFVLNKAVPREIRQQLNQSQISALIELAQKIEGAELSEEKLYSEFKRIAAAHNLKPIDFFKAAYMALLNKQQGPPLAPLIVAVGQEKIANVLDSLEHG